MSLLASLSSVASLMLAAPASAMDPAESWNQILQETVAEERVDYAAVRDEHMKPLEAYLDHAAALDPESLSKDERLATLINVYNATVLHAVAKRLTDDYQVSENDWGLFNEALVRWNGNTVSLNDLEHKLIRPVFNDPRIHVALVCGAVSCPPLIDHAYTAKTLDETLENKMKAFVNDTSRNQVDKNSKALRLSSIFDWYADDFGGKEKLAAYVDRYHEADLSDYSVEFLEYSWELNIQQDAASE